MELVQFAGISQRAIEEVGVNHLDVHLQSKNNWYYVIPNVPQIIKESALSVGKIALQVMYNVVVLYVSNQVVNAVRIKKRWS